MDSEPQRAEEAYEFVINFESLAKLKKATKTTRGRGHRLMREVFFRSSYEVFNTCSNLWRI